MPASSPGQQQNTLITVPNKNAKEPPPIAAKIIGSVSLAVSVSTSGVGLNVIFVTFCCVAVGAAVGFVGAGVGFVGAAVGFVGAAVGFVGAGVGFVGAAVGGVGDDVMLTVTLNFIPPFAQ